jgi:hypothetical protein
MSKSVPPEPTLCPSAPISAPGARVFGVQVRAEDGARRVAYLSETHPVTEKVLRLAGNADPQEVLRASAPCIKSPCPHWSGSGCRLATRVATMLPLSVSALPQCAIRPACRWWKQEGPSACLRCPGVATIDKHPEDSLGTAVSQVRMSEDREAIERAPSPSRG